MVEINNLKTFLSVAKYGSFRKAAEEFFLSPRAVSKQMDQLENELGITLFNRNKNSSELTLEGKQFIIAAEDIVNTYNNELNRITNSQDKNHNLLRVGFSSSDQEIELQHLLKKLLKDNYSVKLEFLQESGRRLLKLVKT
ncbi:LysR family transcriptional regulator, partial [Lactobacillus sp. XV13L]|nr:LysR family transcriptional regulator [Lactobacillus sp. XV13L]